MYFSVVVRLLWRICRDEVRPPREPKEKVCSFAQTPFRESHGNHEENTFISWLGSQYDFGEKVKVSVDYRLYTF